MTFLTKCDWNIWILQGAARILNPRFWPLSGLHMSKAFPAACFALFLASLVINQPVSAQVGPKNGDTWQPNLPGPAPAVANPLVVSDVVVDKEGENAVVARDKAMAESRKAAFMKLAERNMTPAEFKAFKPPKDSDIAMMVQDFEVQDEQMSSTRYVGTFTFRFRELVRNYIDVHTDPGPPPESYTDSHPQTATNDATNDAGGKDAEDAAVEAAEQEAEERADALAQQQGHDAVVREVAPGFENDINSRPSWMETTYGAKARPSLVGARGEPLADYEPIAKTVLVLPYFENISGQTLLWEENNPWLSIWQGALPRTPGGDRKFFVPLGDIGDIAAGPGNGVWSGNYAAVEALMKNYGAEQAVLAVANKSGPEMTVEIYTYKAGKLRRRDTLRPYVGEAAGAEAFKKGVFETISYLQAPFVPRRAQPRVAEQVSRDILAVSPARSNYETVIIDGNTTTAPPVSGRPPLVMKPLGQDYRPYEPVSAQPIIGGGSTRLEASMQFTDSRSWMELQRRVAGIVPPVRMDISSLSSNSVTFTLNSDVPLGTVRQQLYAHGVELGAQGEVRLAPR